MPATLLPSSLRTEVRTGSTTAQHCHPTHTPPSLLLHTTTGTIVLMFSLHNKTCTGNCVSGNAYVISMDGGGSWSKYTNITTAIGKSGEGKARTGPGVGLLLTKGSHKGRLLVPSSTGTYGADHVYLSDDAGKSWRVAKDDSGLGGKGLDESQVTQLPNGTIMMMMRHMAEGYKGKAISTSTDGGETWGSVSYMPALEGPVCQASIVSFGGHTYYSGPDSNSHERVRMTVRRSDDSAVTWPYALRVDPYGAYSCLVDGELIVGEKKEGGVLYEAGGNELLFVRFPLALNGTAA